jgi:putative transposase
MAANGSAILAKNGIPARGRHGHPAHPPPVRRHNEPIVLHVTVCLRRDCGVRLDDEQTHRILVAAWNEATDWRVGEYVVMPDHVHLFCTPGCPNFPPIRRWAGYWKRLVGKKDPRLRGVFQEDCWDTQMRSLANFDEKLSYVRMNPVRKGLVGAWEQWP